MVADTSPASDIRVRVLPFAAAALHFLISIFVAQSPSEGSWQWFPIFVIDFPASIVPLTLFPSSVPSIVAFGLFGSLWWFFLVSAVIWLIRGRKSAA
jgi:hypothetical protein